MPMKQAVFLWSRGVAAERMQAFRIAAAINGVDIDAKREETKEQKRVFASGKPSARGQAVIDSMLNAAKEGEDNG
jgi:hypothetical protein